MAKFLFHTLTVMYVAMFVCGSEAAARTLQEFQGEDKLNEELTPYYDIDANKDENMSVFDRMADFVEGMNEDDNLSRTKRSLSQKVFPRWFKKTCRKYFCGNYSCSTFMYTRGRVVCKKCRSSVCRKGTKVLQFGF